MTDISIIITAHRDVIRRNRHHWHWNVVTLRAGIPHRPVPETIHFKRRRTGSQMSLVVKNDAIIRPD